MAGNRVPRREPTTGTTKPTSGWARKTDGTDGGAADVSDRANTAAVARQKCRAGDAQSGPLLYVRSKGVDDFVRQVHAASAVQIMETERVGVAGTLVKDLAYRMEIPATRMFAMLGVSKATVERRISSGQMLAGNGGRSALGLAKILGIAQAIVENSTAPEARDFDSAKWLGKWLERPQAALGGRMPAESVATKLGVEVIAKLLGAAESGAYQ
jgi:putative toxin-antitoxin system antitoxin component (TIGR02293 family)